jgi:hypothetical protein
MSTINFQEAYAAVYNEDLKNQLLENSDEFFGIEELTDDEIESIVEETVFEMLDEGYDFDELEEVFDEFISEAKVTVGGETGGSGAKVTTGSGSRMAASSRLSNIKAKKRAENIAKVKSAVKSTISKAKEAGKSAIGKAKEAGRSAKFHAVDKKVAAYATQRGLHPAAGAAARSKDPEKRRGLRARVAADIKGRIKKKVAQAQVDTAAKARSAGQAATDAKNKAVQSAKNKAAVAKRGIRGAVGKAARAVASGAGKVASRLGEETEREDLFDVILEYLVSEGYADTNENAIAIMANMSEEWRDSIVEEYKDFPTHKVTTKAGKLMGSSAGKTDSKSKKKEERGIKMMDTMMQHTPDR